MGYDYSYQILQELLTQGNVLDAINSKFGTSNEYLNNIFNRLSLLENIVQILTLVCVTLFGVLLFNVILKWVKK